MDLGSVVGGAISGGLNLIGVRETNKANAASAQAAMGFSRNEAKRQRAWEEKMSNTAYQRGFADMKAAGINPLVTMASFSGASTPSSGAPSGETFRYENPYGGVGEAVSSMFENTIRAAQVKEIKAQASSAVAAARKSNAEASLSELAINDALNKAKKAKGMSAIWDDIIKKVQSSYWSTAKDLNTIYHGATDELMNWDPFESKSDGFSKSQSLEFMGR